MKEFLKLYFTGIGMYLITAIILFGVGAIGYKFLKPFYTSVDNETFKQSQQYNDGMIRDLQNLQMEYNKGTPEQKSALKAIILQRFSVYPEDKLPNDLRSFYENLKRG